MAKTKLHFQLSFTKSSEIVIKNLFKLSPNDKILMAVWYSDNTYSIFDRRGFVITKDGLGWNYLAMAESIGQADSAKERVPRNLEFLEKNNVHFLGTDVRDTETAARSDGKREIQLRTSGTLYIFGFDSGIPKEDIVLLERAIASNFADAFASENFGKKDDSYSLSLTLLLIKDFFSECGRTVKEKISAFKVRINKKAKKIQSTETKNKAVSTVNNDVCNFDLCKTPAFNEGFLTGNICKNQWA